MKKVEADSALSKAVNIVSKSSDSTTKCTRDQVATIFSAAGPVGTVVCPAKCTSRTTDIKGKENRLPTSPTTRKAVCSTDLDQSSPTGTHPTASRASESLAASQKTAAFSTGMGAAHTGSMAAKFPSWKSLLKQIPASVFSEVERKAQSAEIEKLLEKVHQKPQTASQAMYF